LENAPQVRFFISTPRIDTQQHFDSKFGIGSAKTTPQLVVSHELPSINIHIQNQHWLGIQFGI